MSTDRQRRLGRGLEALLSARPSPSDASAAREGARPSALRPIPISQIPPNPLPPRKEFAATALRELEASIRANGLLQPITVRAADRGFELITGERRLRAAQQLGWREIPAIIRDSSEAGDQAILSLALVENLQRTDLNPIEEAEGFQQLISQFSLTQQDVAEVVGKERSTVANTLRLLALPAAVRRLVREGAITLGHARALLALGDGLRMVELAKTIVAEGLNVREVERRVREAGTKRAARRRTLPEGPSRPAEVGRIEDDLRRRLQTDGTIHLSQKDRGGSRGPLSSADDLERVLDLVLGAAREAL